MRNLPFFLSFFFSPFACVRAGDNSAVASSGKARCANVRGLPSRRRKRLGGKRICAKTLFQNFTTLLSRTRAETTARGFCVPFRCLTLCFTSLRNPSFLCYDALYAPLLLRIVFPFLFFSASRKSKWEQANTVKCSVRSGTNGILVSHLGS